MTDLVSIGSSSIRNSQMALSVVSNNIANVNTEGYVRQDLALQVERTMVRLLVMVIMGIATLNIIVGVVMLVKNKTRDIAILRTIGLGRGGVLRVFLLVGTILGTLGAVLGMAVGILVVTNIDAVEAFINLFVPGEVFDAEVYGLEGLPAILDWGEVIRTGLYALGMSMLVSIIPAWWASRQDPVSALRFE